MSEASSRIWIFDHDRITRPYIGGTLLNQWRRMEPAENNHQCEELLVTSIGAISSGHGEGYAISRTIAAQGGKRLDAIIAEDPSGVLARAVRNGCPISSACWRAPAIRSSGWCFNAIRARKTPRVIFTAPRQDRSLVHRPHADRERAAQLHICRLFAGSYRRPVEISV